MRIAITGGIGSGKSYVCRSLAARGIEVFNCDLTAKDIIATDSTVREQLTALIGTPLSKQSLGDYIRTSPDHAARVNAIVHPRVADAFEAYCQPAPTTAALLPSHHWMECAILFESGFDRLVDSVIVVTCPTEERVRRITERDHCDEATSRRWIDLQMTDEERLARAERMVSRADKTGASAAGGDACRHFHILNDGITPIEPQLDDVLLQLHSL